MQVAKTLQAEPTQWLAGCSGLICRIGDTPLVRISRIPEGVVAPDVEIWAKLEWFNPGGSVKDRAAASIILDGERRGLLTPGKVILDSSSGNTGIAYAMVGAARGYKVTLCLPANANAERKRILKAYGVEVIPTDPLEGSDGAIRVAQAMAAENPDLYYYCDQYSNEANWRAHFHSTGPEIWRDTQGRVSHFVATLGTSGTFMGTSRYLKARNPQVACYAVQPDSPFHGLEGLKHMETAIVPAIYQPEGVADGQLGAPTEESLELVRRLAREEGLLAGPSAGAALWAALELGRELESGVIVTIFPDSGTRYLSEEHIWEEPED
ncbi:MAG: cysteine synthase family protein [Alphaproteobacteria bacterium]|nr:cysteine synthase family protein [Alphaproteobacteria bacterium]MCB9791780.1 cysteine synthase family protein [Alphaproteobacteria bacterium]